MTRRRRTVLLVAAALAVVAAALAWTLGARHPQPTAFTIDGPLPAGAVTRIGTGRFGPVGGQNVELLGLSPDGTRLCTLDDFGALRAWDVDTGAPLWEVAAHADLVLPPSKTIDRTIEWRWRVLNGYREPPVAIAVSPDGRRVATGCGALIRVWDAETGAWVAEHVCDENVTTLAWSRDGRRVLRVEKGSVVAWDPARDAETSSPPLAGNWFPIAVRADGVVGAWPGFGGGATALQLLDPETLAPRGAGATTPAGWEPAAAVSGEGRWLVWRMAPAAPRTYEWRWWDPDTGSLVEAGATAQPSYISVTPERGLSVGCAGPAGADLFRGGRALRLASGSVRGAAMSADGRRIALATLKRARVFDAETAKPLHPADVLASPEVFEPLPDGRRLLAGGPDAMLLEIDLATGAVLRTFAVGTSDVDQIVVAPDGSCAVGTAGNVFRVDLATGAVDRFDTRGLVQGVGLRGRAPYGVCSSGNSWAVTNLETGAASPLERAPAGAGVSNVQFTSDGTAVRAEFGAVQVVSDTATGRALDDPPAFPATPGFVHSDDLGWRRVADRRTLAPIVDLDRPPQVLPCWPCVLDDAHVAVGEAASARRSEIAVYSRADGHLVARLRPPPGEVPALRLVPGGRFLVSGHADGTLLVWDLTRGAR